MSRIVKIALYALLFAGIPYAVWLCQRNPGPITVDLTNSWQIICTPGRGHYFVMPRDFVGPPKPYPWPPLELPDWPFAPMKVGEL
jgi:hypothetical protein